MRAAIASTNKAKVSGAARALRLLGVSEVIARSVRTRIEQPLSFAETALMAIERIEQLVKLVDADYYVSIEGGVIASLGYPLEGQVAIVANRHGLASVGISSVFPLPQWFIRQMPGHTLEDIMVDIVGLAGIGRRHGAVGYFTHGYMTRLELSYQSVLAALIPFLNRDTYRELIGLCDLKKTIKTRVNTHL